MADVLLLVKTWQEQSKHGTMLSRSVAKKMWLFDEAFNFICRCCSKLLLWLVLLLLGVLEVVLLLLSTSSRLLSKLSDNG